MANELWKTIGSAPKDGTAILGFPIFGYTRPREIYWLAGKWISPGSPGAQEPTMWREWPDPPTAGVTFRVVGGSAPEPRAEVRTTTEGDATTASEGKR